MLDKTIDVSNQSQIRGEKLEIYATGESPTDPKNVNSRTRLDSLNLSWKEKDLPESERTKHVHRLHPYLGKYIPQLVEVFLRKFFKPGQTILDPFSGSGTSLVQANELGINSVGVDISEFNVLLARAKTKKYSINKLRKEVTDILEKVSFICESNPKQANLPFDTEVYVDDDFYSEYLRSWYAPQALRELLAFRNLIPKYDDQDILKVILARSARSARMTPHYDLDFPKQPQTEEYYCYKHRRMCQPTQTAYKFLKRYCLDTIKRIEQFAEVRTNAKVKVLHGDSRTINPGRIDGVITSPPYVGLIDYHAQHQYAYELLQLEDCRDLEIGPAKKGSSNKAREEYKKLIAETFENALDYMKKGSHLIVVAGDKHELYPDIARRCRVNQKAVIKRHVNRRTGRRSGEFFESIFIWKKK